MRHSWDKNTPSKGYSTCANCGISVKTYRIRKGRLPSCDPERRKQATIEGVINYIPPCMDGDKNVNPVISCFNCPGRIKVQKCDNLKKQGGFILENRTITH